MLFRSVSRMVELRNRLQAARYRLPLRGVLDELIAVLVDDAIAIEDDEFHGREARPRDTGLWP